MRSNLTWAWMPLNWLRLWINKAWVGLNLPSWPSRSFLWFAVGGNNLSRRLTRRSSTWSSRLRTSWMEKRDKKMYKKFVLFIILHGENSIGRVFMFMVWFVGMHTQLFAIFMSSTSCKLSIWELERPLQGPRQ